MCLCVVGELGRSYDNTFLVVSVKCRLASHNVAHSNLKVPETVLIKPPGTAPTVEVKFAT